MTVGYGDITAQSTGEKIVCIVLMLIGVVAFSFATGSISTIIANQDSADAKLKEKMSTLKGLQSEYEIESGLFNKIAKALQYGN
jgi:predicted transcriptional regulator YdeE